MTNWKIEGFNLNEHLPEVEITVETHPDVTEDDGVFEYRFKEKRLGSDLLLFLSESGQAALEFDRKGSVVEFMWVEEVAEAFNNIDTIKVVDLFDVLTRNPVILRGDSR